ncbi:DUF6585 family protein [Mesobacillus subterraneus]|uniref:DUF6585 family protein n=1 Tax=Mesobacillus subterraneus TaxID=285983 RepID=UPI00299F096A|nr:DUF6585 family protein [Mesobacillus subterraneus]
MKNGTISRNPLIIFYFIFLGILAWFSAAKNVLANGDWMVIAFASLPLIPLIGLPLLFLQTRIEIYQEHITYISGFKKKTYSLRGIEKVYRRTVKDQFSGEGFQNFQYVAFKYEDGFILSLPFSFVSLAKNTPKLLKKIEKMNPDVVFDKDISIIKSGKPHPMNKVIRFLTLGLGTIAYLIFIF